MLILHITGQKVTISLMLNTTSRQYWWLIRHASQKCIPSFILEEYRLYVDLVVAKSGMKQLKIWSLGRKGVLFPMDWSQSSLKGVLYCPGIFLYTSCHTVVDWQYFYFIDHVICVVFITQWDRYFVVRMFLPVFFLYAGSKNGIHSLPSRLDFKISSPFPTTITG